MAKASFVRKLYAFIFCLVLATFFWILNALSNNYKTDVVFDVVYSNISEDKIILNELPSTLSLKVKGLGFDLMAYKWRLFKSRIKVDLSTLNTNNKNQSIESKIVSTDYFKSRISSQLGNQIEILDIYPDSIHFILDTKAKKIVKVVSQTNITYKQQYQLYGSIKVKPAVVEIIGPKSILDTLENVYTANFEFEELDKTLTGNVGFDESYNSKNIKFMDEAVSLHIPVEKYTESTNLVSLTYLNVPDSFVIKAIPNEIEIKYMLPLNKIANKSNSEIEAYIDFNDIDEKFSSKLKVNLSEYPEYINTITVNPSKVEYILKKRK
jgi:hypothetical protein